MCKNTIKMFKVKIASVNLFSPIVKQLLRYKVATVIAGYYPVSYSAFSYSVFAFRFKTNHSRRCLVVSHTDIDRRLGFLAECFV